MKDIEKLLKKYWEGETTLEEEKLIKKHFASDNPTNDNMESLFTFFENEKKITYQGNLQFPKKKVLRLNFYREMAVAASIVLLLGLAFLIKNNINQNHKTTLAKYEVKDPKKAKEITKNALALLAKKYNKGETALSQNIKNIDKINIFNSLIKNN